MVAAEREAGAGVSMFGFGKKKEKQPTVGAMTAATAAEFFIKSATENAVNELLRWEKEITDGVKMFGHDPAAIHSAVRKDDAILIYTGTMMALSLRAPKNLFAPDVSQAIYANVARELSSSKPEWMNRFVFNILAQSQTSNSIGFEAYALLAELGITKADPKLEEFMTGPIFMLKLMDFEHSIPITSFWKRLSEVVKIVP